jgi:hypothetical protein
MRSPVYRNLDRPLQILGYSPVELIVLSLVFVIGGEVAQFMGISRTWAFVGTFVLALVIFTFHKYFGELFIRRLIRFAQLPSELHPKILIKERLAKP